MNYGRLAINGKRQLAHRIAWELINGPIPDGMDVCHECDNPPCINPEHLFLGTHKTNMRDCIKKGRFVLPPNPNANKTHCKNGHSLAVESGNVWVNKNGSKQCKVCHLAACARSYLKKKNNPKPV